MDLRNELLSEHSKSQTIKIAQYIGSDKDRFAALVQLFLHDEYRVVQRASWAINYCVEKHPEFIEPYYSEIIALLDGNPIDAVKRNVVRMLQYVDIPDEWQGYIYDICFRFVSTLKEPVAVRAFSMQVLYNIGNHIPELKAELRELLKDCLDSDKPGIRSRSKNLLTKLN